MKPLTYTAAQARLTPDLCAKIDDANERVALLEEEIGLFQGDLAYGLSNLAAESRITEADIRAWLGGLRCVMWGRWYDLGQESSRDDLVTDLLETLAEIEAVRDGT